MARARASTPDTGDESWANCRCAICRPHMYLTNPARTEAQTGMHVFSWPPCQHEQHLTAQATEFACIEPTYCPLARNTVKMQPWPMHTALKHAANRHAAIFTNSMLVHGTDGCSCTPTAELAYMMLLQKPALVRQNLPTRSSCVLGAMHTHSGLKMRLPHSGMVRALTASGRKRSWSMDMACKGGDTKHQYAMLCIV